MRGEPSDGLVDRRALPVVPPHVEYSLTTHGPEASVLLEPLVAWAARQAGQQPGRSAQDAAGASSAAS